jgi:MFS family permease
LSISAVDAITPAFQHSRQQLLQPFRAGQWAKLGLVGLLAGELSSGGGGCNPGSFQMPTHPNHSQRLLDIGLAGANPMLYASLLVVLMVAGLVLMVLFLYANSVMRFVLFDSVVAKECRIRENWNRRQGPGRRYFFWQILLFLSWIAGATILIGIPAGFAFLVGWLKDPKEHMIPLILGGMALFFVLMVFVVAQLVVHVMTKDFVVPQMALEEIGAIEGWRRLWPQIKAEKGGYAGYLGMKIVLAIAAAIVLGIVSAIVMLLFLIPVGGLGAVAVIAGMAAGLTWNLYTITLAVVAGCLAIFFILYILSLVSVPAVVFFPAYAIYFFASRYPALDALLHPVPPPPLISPPPPEPPPLPPAPEPIG